MTLGRKIQRLRRDRGLSQEALAERLAVTRQTISKWELDQSTPELGYIARLSGIFGVSADYLIREDLTEPDQPPADPKGKRTFTERHRRWVLGAVSAGAMAGVFVCLVCDYAITGTLTWSRVAAVSTAAGWCALAPGLGRPGKRLRNTLAVLSILPFPYLAALSVLLGQRMVLTLGSCVAVPAILGLWAVCAILRRHRRRLWRGMGLSLLALIPVAAAIDALAARFVSGGRPDSLLFNAGTTLLLAAGCFLADHLTGGGRGET